MAVTALAVATKEATAKDSNAVYLQPVKVIAVAIRKVRKLANGYRLADALVQLRWGTVLSALVPLCGEAEAALRLPQPL